MVSHYVTLTMITDSHITDVWKQQQQENWQHMFVMDVAGYVMASYGLTVKETK